MTVRHGVNGSLRLSTTIPRVRSGGACYAVSLYRLGGQPTLTRLRFDIGLSLAVGRYVTPNNALERTMRHGGPRLAAARSSWASRSTRSLDLTK
jgi:hypothetical protein